MAKDKSLNDNPRKAIFLGAAWAVGMRWSVKAIGLLNTAIMARFLAPEDYGIVAMAYLVVGLVEIFLDVGAGAALVRLKKVTKEQIDSAWTLRGLQGILIGTIIALVSPLAVTYFNEPRVQNVLLVVGSCIALMGFSNIGMTLAYKNLEFALEYRVAILTKVFGVIATLIAALFLPDYRALVVGIVTGYIFEWTLSYLMHPYRPSWNTSKFGEIWGVSKWMMMTGIGGYFLRRTDQLVAGRIANANDYGLYSVGSEIGQLPAGELGPTMVRSLFPILASLQNDVERAKSATLKTLAAVNTVTMPLGLGLAAVSQPVTMLLLGEKWTAATPFITAFAIIGTTQFIMIPFNALLNVRGHLKAQTNIVWIQFAIFCLSCYPLTLHFQLMGIVAARMISGLSSGIMLGIVANRILNIRVQSIAAALFRPLLGSILMYFLIDFILIRNLSPFFQVLQGVAVGGFFFPAWIFFTWFLVGKPDGVERTIYDQGIKILEKFNRKS